MVGLKPPNEPGAVRHFLPTDACPRVAFFFRAQCIAQSLHPGRQGRKERGNLVGEQRLQRVEEGVNGPLDNSANWSKDTQAHFFAAIWFNTRVAST